MKLDTGSEGFFFNLIEFIDKELNHKYSSIRAVCLKQICCTDEQLFVNLLYP